MNMPKKVPPSRRMGGTKGWGQHLEQARGHQLLRAQGMLVHAKGHRHVEVPPAHPCAADPDITLGGPVA